MKNTTITTVRDLVAKSEDIGYNLALTDLMRELRIRHEDGFVLSDNLLTEVLDMLCEKRNKKQFNEEAEKEAIKVGELKDKEKYGK
jgi:hypothetical protein